MALSAKNKGVRLGQVDTGARARPPAHQSNHRATADALRDAQLLRVRDGMQSEGVEKRRLECSFHSLHLIKREKQRPSVGEGGRHAA